MTYSSICHASDSPHSMHPALKNAQNCKEWSARLSGVIGFLLKQLMAPGQSVYMKGTQRHLQAHRIMRCRGQTRWSEET